MALRKSPSMNYERLQALSASADMEVSYRFVKFTNDSDGEVALAGADEDVHGVLIHGGKAGKTVEVLIEHGARVILEMDENLAQANIQAGQRLGVAANGRAKTVAAGAQDAPYHAVVVGEGILSTQLDGTPANNDGVFVEAIFLPNTTAA